MFTLPLNLLLRALKASIYELSFHCLKQDVFCAGIFLADSILIVHVRLLHTGDIMTRI